MSSVRRILQRFRPRKTPVKTSENAPIRVRSVVASEADLRRILLTNTVVTPPHSVSNLRRVILRTLKDETPEERVYRKAYEEVQLWNHHYWVAHNELFQRERARFVMENTPSEGSEQLDANKMAVFYRQFLNENQDKHWSYNLEWYRRHFGLLPLDLRARWSRLKVRFSRSQSARNGHS